LSIAILLYRVAIDPTFPDSHYPLDIRAFPAIHQYVAGFQIRSVDYTGAFCELQRLIRFSAV
jgi:hypothetical protein